MTKEIDIFLVGPASSGKSALREWLLRQKLPLGIKVEVHTVQANLEDIGSVEFGEYPINWDDK